MANPNPNPAAVPAKDPEEIDWLSLFRECANILRRRWKWFVLSVIVCLVLAFLYQQKQARVYQRTATVLVEDASGTGGSRRMSGNMNALLELNGITTGDLTVGGLFDLSQKNMHRAKLGQVECQTFRLAKESNTELDMGDLTADTDIQLTTTGIGRMTTGRLSTKGTLTLNCAQQTASSLGDIACRELRADLSGKCQLKLPAVEVKGDVSLAARDVSTITFTTLATDGDISVTRQNMATLSVGTLDCTTLTLHSSGDGWLNPESEKTKKAFLLVSRPGGGINITHMVNPSPYVIENKGKSTLEINPYSNDGNDIRFKDGYHIVLQKPSRQLTQLP